MVAETKLLCRLDGRRAANFLGEIATTPRAGRDALGKLPAPLGVLLIEKARHNQRSNHATSPIRALVVGATGARSSASGPVEVEQQLVLGRQLDRDLRGRVERLERRRAAGGACRRCSASGAARSSPPATARQPEQSQSSSRMAHRSRTTLRSSKALARPAHRLGDADVDGGTSRSSAGPSPGPTRSPQHPARPCRGDAWHAHRQLTGQCATARGRAPGGPPGARSGGPGRGDSARARPVVDDGCAAGVIGVSRYEDHVLSPATRCIAQHPAPSTTCSSSRGRGARDVVAGLDRPGSLSFMPFTEQNARGRCRGSSGPRLGSSRSAAADADVGAGVHRDGAVTRRRGSDQHASAEHDLQLGRPDRADRLGGEAKPAAERRGEA